MLSLCIVKWRSLNYFDKHWLCGQFSWNDNYLINGLKHFHLFGFGWVSFVSSRSGKKRARTNFFPIHLNGFFIYLHRNCTTARFTEQLHFNFPNCYYFSMLVFPKSWHTQIAAACKDDGKVVTVSLFVALYRVANEMKLSNEFSENKWKMCTKTR